MARIKGKTRQEVFQAVQERYSQASRPDWSRILDEFVASTGYHRKHAIRVLNGSLRPETSSIGAGLRGRRRGRSTGRADVGCGFG